MDKDLALKLVTVAIGDNLQPENLAAVVGKLPFGLGAMVSQMIKPEAVENLLSDLVKNLSDQKLSNLDELLREAGYTKGV